MPFDNLERAIGEQHCPLPGNLLEEASSKSYDLYKVSIGREKLTPADIVSYKKGINNLSLPQKISVYLDLRNKSIEEILKGHVPQGKDRIKAARYFLKNHIILSGYKSEIEVKFTG